MEMLVKSLVLNEIVDAREYLCACVQRAKQVGGTVWGGHLTHNEKTLKIFSVKPDDTIHIDLPWELRDEHDNTVVGFKNVDEATTFFANYFGFKHTKNTNFKNLKAWITQEKTEMINSLKPDGFKFFAFDINVNAGTYSENGQVAEVEYLDRCRISEFGKTHFDHFCRMAIDQKFDWISFELCPEARMSFHEDWELIEIDRPTFDINFKDEAKTNNN